MLDQTTITTHTAELWQDVACFFMPEPEMAELEEVPSQISNEIAQKSRLGFRRKNAQEETFIFQVEKLQTHIHLHIKKVLRGEFEYDCFNNRREVSTVVFDCQILTFTQFMLVHELFMGYSFNF